MFCIKYEQKNIKRALLILEIIFITAGIISIILYGNSLLLGSLQKFNNDDVKYIRSAWNLLDNKILSYENIKEPTVFIMPGLTYVLAFFMLIFGKFGGITAFRVFQVILQAGSLYLIFLIGRKVFNSKIALTACILDMLYIVEIYTANLILMECLFKFVFLMLIYISIFAIEKKDIKLYAAGGVLWALSCMFKPVTAAYPVLILIMWIKKKYKLMEIIKYTAVVTAIFCTIMMPWWVRNYNDFHMVIPFTKSTGNPFLQGTFINNNKSIKAGVPVVYSKNPIQDDKNQMDAGIARLKKYGSKEPVKYVYWYTIGKSFFFWRLPFYWDRVFDIPEAVVYVFHVLILFVGAAGIITGLRSNINAFYIFSAAIFLNLMYLPFYTFSRYSYPVMPIIMIFAANFLQKISEKHCIKVNKPESN